MIHVSESTKRALRKGTYPKRYSIHVFAQPGKNGFHIENENLLSDAVQITERLSSGDIIKFGLSEGSSIEFTYFGLPEITGRSISVLLEVANEDGIFEDSIFMGYFKISNCVTDKATGQRKATGYNKLQSEYLDFNGHDIVADLQSDGPDISKITLYELQDALLTNFDIRREVSQTVVPAFGTIVEAQVSGITMKLVGSSTTRYPYIKSEYVKFDLTGSNRVEFENLKTTAQS